MINHIPILSLLLFLNIFNAGFCYGKVIRINNFQSKYVDQRNIDIFLPENYSENEKYSVLYMHDGQMLFDSTLCWNKKEWKADENINQLLKEKKIENCIVVGIWNNGSKRIAEYFPNKMYDSLEKNVQDKFSDMFFYTSGPQGDQYLRFIVEELKPFIDRQYPVYSDKYHTFIMGSSMGGIISLYALCEYPEIFSGAASMSTAWLNQVEPNYAMPLAVFDYLKENLPPSHARKIYCDYGTGESDSNYENTQMFVDRIIRAKGYDENNYKSLVFQKAIHDEISWSNRLFNPLIFLLPKKVHQKASAGKIELYENFESKYVTSRDVEVWLPENYSKNKKYAVLYMHDGQMLFDASTSWNKQSWEIDEVAAGLMQTGKVRDFIIVGISNGGKTRHSDYFPEKAWNFLTPEQKQIVSDKLAEKGRAKTAFQPASDNYLKFLVTELKPFIDKHYPVYTDAKNTFIAGSSMGGLISMYAICEYPDVFGGAACLSTHWPGIFEMNNNPVPEALFQYMKQKLPEPKTHKIYFDYGNKTLDELYPPLQQKADTILKEKGFNKRNWETLFFENADHSENAWHERVYIPLIFLLK